MNVSARTPLPVVAATVGAALRRHGIVAVLTGGSCASVYTGGSYHSVDVDFVLKGRVTQAKLDAAMAEVGFERHRDRYVHPRSSYYVEFPPGPLAVGSDYGVEPVEVAVGDSRTLALSATDSCRDRLSAFYHWADRQSLAVAVTIALTNRVNLRTIRRWSTAEGQQELFEEFLSELQRARRSR